VESGKRVAIVTGASQGVGRAIGERLARDGWHVILYARRKEKLDEVVAGIEAEGGSAEAAVVDMRAPDAIAAAIGEAAERHGRLDGLVNNAGRFSGRAILDTSLDEFRLNFVMNVEAVFVAMKAALPVMIARRGGAIVNIGSVSGLRASTGTGGYGASKAALFHLGAITAMEVGEHNIRVNTVTPGSTWSPSFERSVRDRTPDEIAAMEKGGTILGRFAQPSEIADAVAFLLSDDARFITGVNLPVDGGAYWFRGGNRMIGRRN
jgi:meso-butanediol dehydrogenase/(S,S)-butanediol dehydrogenase/diacetyl reductase